MLRIIHTADVHLGARHDDLGEQAAAQRERQFAAFKAAIDLALAEKVDLFLIAGDLFDSNVQPRRSVERVAAELKRLVDARIRTVIIPGTHDVYDRASIYRAYDLPALAGSTAATTTSSRSSTRTARRSTCPRSTRSSTAGSSPPSARRTARSRTSPPTRRRAGPPRPGTIGMVHGSIAIPGKTDRDEVVITTDEIAASGLDYLALGHWHSAQTGKAGAVTYAYSGAPEAVALDQDRAGKVLLVELDERAGNADRHGRGAPGRADDVREARGRRRDGRQPAGPHRAPVGQRPTRTSSSTSGSSASGRDELDLDIDEIEAALAPSFLKVRVRDASLPALTEGPLPSPDTIAGAFIRDLEARIAELEARRLRRPRRPSRATPSASAGCSWPATRSRCEDPPAARSATSGAIATLDIDLAPGPDRRPRPERGRQDAPSSARSSWPSPGASTSAAGELEALRPWDAPADARSIITIEFEQDDEDGTQDRHAREDVRRREGDGPSSSTTARRSRTRRSPTR